MKKQSQKILNAYQLNRFQDCPRIGDTCTTLSLKFLYAIDDNDKKIQLTFKSYSQSFKQVLNRFIIHSKPIQPINSQYAIEYMKTEELVSENKPLQLFKLQIQDIQHIYFRIYPIETHSLNKKLKSLQLQSQQSKLQYPNLYYEQNKINVNVKRPNGQMIQILASKLLTVKLLKYQICKSQNISYEEFNLFFAGKKLADQETSLDDYGIQQQSIVFLVMLGNKGCFSPSSFVHVTINEVKRISELSVGDSVLSYNEVSKKLEMDQIISIHKTLIRHYLRVILQDSTIIQCTQNHKFIDDSNTWRSFQYQDGKKIRLQKGSRIRNIHNNLLAITQIQYAKTQQPLQFVHISTKNQHNFFLNSFLSHNMQIKIKNSQNGQEILVNITEMDTIQMLKIKLQPKINISKDQILLVLNKKQLKNSQSISDYLQQIKNCNFLEMIIHEKHTIVINRIKQKKQYKFKFNKDLTVRDLKKQISKVIQVDKEQLILIINNIEMLNKQKIGEFQLHKNYNRINLIEILEGQITQSKVQFFKTKILYVKIGQNQYLTLNYFSLKEMRVDQFIMSFVPNSKRCYSLHFGEFILSPKDLLKQLQDSAVFNNEQINCYVIQNYDKLAFYRSFDFNQQFKEQPLKLDASYLQFCQSKIPVIKQTVESCGYIYDVKNKFKEQLPFFYKPIMYYSNVKVNSILQSFLNKLVQAEPKSIEGHNFCQSLIKSLSIIPPFLEECFRLIKDTRFRQIYKKGDTFYFQSFLSTHSKIASINKDNRKNYTLLHIQSITGKNISKISQSQDQVVFLPFTYFYVKKIISNTDFDEVWLIEVPSPQSFTKDIFMWVDDQPNSQQNKMTSNLIDLSRYELVQLVRTSIAEYWMKQFGWIIKWKNLQIKVMSDMQRKQGEEDAMVVEAGIDLIQSFHNNFGYTTPIFIYCKNVFAARKSLASRKIEPVRVKKITSDQFELLNYIGS